MHYVFLVQNLRQAKTIYWASQVTSSLITQAALGPTPAAGQSYLEIGALNFAVQYLHASRFLKFRLQKLKIYIHKYPGFYYLC